MRNLRTVINDIPIRYFMPLGFLVAAGIALLVYAFVALPAAEEQAFFVTEKDFSDKVDDMRGQFNMLLAQGDAQAVSQAIFVIGNKPSVIGIALIGQDERVRFAGNIAFNGHPFTDLPFHVDAAMLKRAMATGQMMYVRDRRAHVLTGYIGLGSVEQGVMVRHVLVVVQSTAALSDQIKGIAKRAMEILVLTFVVLAAAVGLLVRAKMDQRLDRLLDASKRLASEEDDLGQIVEGRDEFGQIAGQLRKTADILARKRATLMEALDKAKAASVAKSEFLSNMSHEIRTPMNGVISGLNLLQSSTNEAEKEELAAAALNSAHALLIIINDILDFSKLEAGRLTISPGPFLLARMLKDIQVLMRPMAFEKETALTLDMDEGCDLRIVADEVRLRQVITNLVGNAIKFTTAGSVTISAKLTGEDRKLLEVQVTDTGSGIAENEQALLFRRFSQLGNSVGQKLRGTGLGLAICKQIVQLMGGEIGVESALGKGSCFWFRVPVDLAPGEEKATHGGDVPDVGAGLTILLAEDVHINQMLITKLLGRLGHRVVLAENGQEALDVLDRADEGEFDLILLDNQMPVLSGLEAARRVRARGDAKGRIPIIALTADALAEQREAFMAVGMNGFVSKPILIDKLRFEIARAMAGHAAASGE